MLTIDIHCDVSTDRLDPRAPVALVPTHVGRRDAELRCALLQRLKADVLERALEVGARAVGPGRLRAELGEQLKQFVFCKMRDL